MQSVIDLQPYVAPLWFKQQLVSKVSTNSYFDSIATQFDSSVSNNIWREMGESVKNKNPSKALIIQTEI